jgi:DUF4097 and DUF4098 domain-containing protein YvlB
MAVPEPISITTRRGSVTVAAADGAELRVEGGTVGRSSEGRLEIHRDSGASHIEVRCASGSDVSIGTASGSVECTGLLGSVRIATVSGRVSVDAAEKLDVRTRSGTVEVGDVSGECRVMTTSAKVHVRSAGYATVATVSGHVSCGEVDRAEVKTVSGKVALSTTGTGRVAAKTISGRVDIRVPPDRNPATRLRSVSGKIDSECPPGNDGDVLVATVSGRIKVSRA